MSQPQQARRVVEVNQRVIGPPQPRLKTVRPRKLSDYAHVSAAHRDVAQCLARAHMMGPPICDELMDLVQHLFTEEEAGVARHLGMFSGRSAADLARKEHRPVEQITPIVRRLADEKRIIGAGGPSADRRYRLLPIMPGIFEMSLISHSPETLTDWHLRFIELFETLYETGYALDYQSHTPIVRFLPIGKVIDAHPMALPTDKLEVVLDQFQVFAVGHCQCRMTAVALGRGCGKPLENCMVMGEWAARGIEEGALRQISKKDALQIKREAESHQLVNWMMNVQSTKGQCSCSCCGCCCHAMRAVNEFNAPGLIAPPHFIPKLEAAKCTSCGKCAKSCPMGAITVDTLNKTYHYQQERCVGCGLCVLACDAQHALAMNPVPDYRLPYGSWFSLLTHAAPGMLATSWKVWRERRAP
jgi:Pyruvate/2-oxoacid:ferredoxin oxidoreductase delta subunit